jgi:hypothetical protein
VAAIIGTLFLLRRPIGLVEVLQPFLHTLSLFISHHLHIQVHL